MVPRIPISKLSTSLPRSNLTADALNVVLDLYSRFVVAWRVARRENMSSWQIGRLSV